MEAVDYAAVHTHRLSSQGESFEKISHSFGLRTDACCMWHLWSVCHRLRFWFFLGHGLGHGLSARFLRFQRRFVGAHLLRLVQRLRPRLVGDLVKQRFPIVRRRIEQHRNQRQHWRFIVYRTCRRYQLLGHLGNDRRIVFGPWRQLQLGLALRDGLVFFLD